MTTSAIFTWSMVLGSLTWARMSPSTVWSLQNAVATRFSANRNLRLH